MFWFDKQNPHAVFVDNRTFSGVCCDGRTVNVAPDIIADFTALPFDDKQFKLVVFDPPHIANAGKGSWIAQKYGRLGAGWEQMLKQGFGECMRVLDDYGVLVFKWSAVQITVTRILQIVGQQPLFGHKSGKASNTHWMCFMRIPEVKACAQNN